MNRLAKAYKKFCATELTIGAILLISTVFILTIAAILRTVGLPINWGLDLALLMFTWSVYIGADTALRDDKMVNVDLLQQYLSPVARKALQITIYILILIFLSFLVYFGFRLAYSSRYRTFQGIPFLSYTWATLSIPIPATFMIITVVLKIIKLLKQNPMPTSAESSQGKM